MECHASDGYADGVFATESFWPSWPVIALVVSSVVGVVSALVTLWKSVIVVRQGTRVVIERLGEYKSTLQPGLHILTPYVELARAVQWSYTGEESKHGRTQTKEFYINTHEIPVAQQLLDLPEYEVISSDRLPVFVNCVLWWRIVDVQKAVYGVTNLTKSLEQLVQTEIRDVISREKLDDAIQKKSIFQTHITEHLRGQLRDTWGVEIVRVEVQEIDASEEIRRATTDLVVKKREASAREAQVDAERLAKLSECQTKLDVEMADAAREREVMLARLEKEREEYEAEERRKNAIAEAERARQLAEEQNLAEIELCKRRAATDADMYAKDKEREMNAKRRQTEADTEHAILKQSLEARRVQYDIEEKHAREMAEISGAEVQAQIAGGLPPETFIQREYTRNIGAALSGNNTKIHFIPGTQVGDFMAAAAIHDTLRRTGTVATGDGHNN